MLTMGKPIRLNGVRPVGTLGDMFGERIRGNYGQIRGHMCPMDLLHFLSEPPVVYLAEAGMTSLVSQQNVTEIYNTELSLVNNVLNRILVSGHMALTYQDRVFVENILGKLGVTDVQEFIRQVRIVKEEAGSVRELLSLYKSGQESIRRIQEYRLGYLGEREAGKAETEEKKEETETGWDLAVKVLERLRTEEIYREISACAACGFESRTVLDRREMAVCWQELTAIHLALHNDRRRTYAREQTLVYNGPDIYEAGNVSHTDGTYGQTVENLVQTALLNAVRQIFHIRYAELTRHTGWWHEFMDALHVSVRNTFQGFVSRHNRMSFTLQDKKAYHRTAQHFGRQEIHALKTFFSGGTGMTVHAPRYMKLTRSVIRHQTPLPEIPEGDADAAARGQDVPRPQERQMQEPAGLPTGREEEIVRQLDRINRQNIERLEKLSAYTGQRKEPKKRRVNREMAKADALRALTEPEQVMLEYRERETVRSAQKERERENLREILGEETVRMFETIRGYRETPGQYPNVTTSEGQAMNLFIRDITAAGKPLTAVRKAEPATPVHDGIQHIPPGEVERVFQERVPGVEVLGRRPEGTPGQMAKGVELLHRQSGQTVSEERWQEFLQTGKKNVQVQKTDIRENTAWENQTAGMVQSKVNEMKYGQDEEIERLISQGIKRQLDTLSEQVYGKLERRLDAERRRRGL